MNIELNRKLRQIKNELNNDYIISKLKVIRKSNNIDNITQEETNLIIDLINEEYNQDKKNLIQNILEENYQNKKFKFLYNKENYINKNKKIIIAIIDNIQSYLSNKYNINNNYSLYYCKSYAQLCIDTYQNTKNYKLLKYIVLKISTLEEKYSDKLKMLYKLSGNYEELNKIRRYEEIDRNYQLNEQIQISETINALSNNVKTLKRNAKL